ncbi:unannotated protein [freshwater metagenome]|uniref:Unannotated protein n=1 Tax=freshwater metagenome TaxID=449393 RepID=A0A6J6LEU8_9ZZZZ
MAWKSTRLSVLAELANTWSEDDRTGERSNTTSSMHNTRTGEVDVAIAPVQRVAKLGEPAAAPGPRTEKWVVDGTAEQAPDNEGLELPALSHRASGNGCGGVHERHHVKEECGCCARVGKIAAVEPGTGPSALPQEDPITGTDECAASSLVQAVIEARQHIAVATEHERPTNKEEANKTKEEDRKVRADNVRSVLGSTETGFDKCEPSLHKDDHGCTDDDPEKVS